MDNIPFDLESILMNCFGCKNPFRKNPICTDTEPDGNKICDRMTKAGRKAYDKLISCVYALETMGVIDDANDVIKRLDEVISENGAYCT